jgi:hypothetical protein
MFADVEKPANPSDTSRRMFVGICAGLASTSALYYCPVTDKLPPLA